MESPLRSILARRRDRTIAIILSAKERECDDVLDDAASDRLRKVVLDQLNDFHDFCADLLRGVEETTIFNEIALEKIEEIHEMVRDIYEEE